MQLKVFRSGIDGTPTEALVEHGTESLVMNINLFDKMTNVNGYDIFAEINGYWNYIPIASQNRIFDVYKRIKETYDTVWDTNELTKTLYVLVAELYNEHNLEDLNHWVTFHSNVIIPNGLRDTFKESYENPGTRERTYLKDDYKWLVVLSIALRVMVPVWGEFIARTRKETGTVFKEYYAYLLLAYSSIAKSEPMERLKIYVEHSIPMEKSKSSAILGGLCSEEFPVWMLGLIVVRRLCICDVRGIDLDPTAAPLVTIIYKFIGQKVKGHDGSFLGQIKEKLQEGLGTEGENNLSKLEGYKTKQEIPAGDIALINYYLSDINKIALRISPNINLELVEDALVSVNALLTEQIWKPQTILVQWILKSQIPPKGILNVNKQLYLRATALVQAILWDKGYFELAGLVSATVQSNQEELMLITTDGKARITKDQLEQLDLLYPYSRKPVGKQKVVKRINPAVEAIESISSLFNDHNWKLTLQPKYLTKLTGSETSVQYSTPYNLKVLLADLAIKLANRTF